MHGVAEVDIYEITQPTELFSHPNKLNPMDLANNKTTPAENHQDNGTSPPHGTQPSSLHSPLIDSLVALDEPPLRPCAEAVNAARLANTSYHPEVRPNSDDDALFGVYQNFLRQNSGNHLYGRIKDDSKWQDRWIKLFFLPTQCYNVTSGLVVKKFVSILLVDLNAIRSQKLNSKRVIFFQSVILQRVRLVTGTKNICAGIKFQLNFWIHDVIDETTPTPRLPFAWVGIAGPKVSSNGIVHFIIFFYV